MSRDTKQSWREDQAKAEIGHTDISRPAAVYLLVLLIAVITSVPAVQHLQAWRESREGAKPESIAFYGRFSGVLEAMGVKYRKAGGWLDRLLSPNAELLKRINQFQSAMDDSCVVTRLAAGRTQEFLCRLGAGNEKAFVGRNGWLFYEPSVRYLTGPGFLDPVQLRKRSRSGAEYSGPVQPDPVRAVIDFRDQLRKRGVELVVVPVPVKAAVHPEGLSSRFSDNPAVLQNASYSSFVSGLEREGVFVFDPSSLLAGIRKNGPVFLKTDTHWRPEAMQAAAAGIAGFIREKLPPLPEASLKPSPLSMQEIDNLGDIAVMLKLPQGQDVFARETVSVLPVKDADTGSPDVLLLGDSFANIYSEGQMGWGEDSGFGEHLALALQRPVERIVRNDAGAFATREKLAQDMLRGRDVLDGKRILVWEFAARELAVGNWKIIDLVYRPKQQDDAPPEPVADGGLVSCMVESVSSRPEQGAPYKDFIMKLYVRDMMMPGSVLFGEGDGVVFVYGMKDRRLLPFAGIQAGSRVKLQLRPWEEVEKDYGTLKMGALDDDMLEIDKTLYWGEEPGNLEGN